VPPRAILFVSNGHDEAAIADRIAQEIRALAPDVIIDHLPLVGDSRAANMREVGPRAVMPSGGLIAMGNVRNIARDVGNGLLALTLRQRSFLRASRGGYERVVAIGDVFALLMALAAGAPTAYVGTAKSVRVAPYGRVERMVLRRADPIFVRDEPTAQRLRAERVDAIAPGNVIVDLFGDEDARADATVAGFDPAIAIFPGSRQSAYGDAAFLLAVVRGVAQTRPCLGAVLSIAPLLEPQRFIERFRAAGLQVDVHDDARMPFSVRDGSRVLARAWHGSIGPLLSRVRMVAGQAGTANEAAAAAGIPVVAFERERDRKTAWYRMRQHGLLGEALEVLPGDLTSAIAGLASLLDDAPRRAAMGAQGRERMGGPGGARAIARAVVAALP
jgi:uncharacterized protein (TIGR03492 family)